MHLALVTAYPPSKGSLNEYGYHFAKSLAAKPDVRVSIVADTLIGEPSSEEQLDDVDVRRVWSFNSAGNVWAIAKTLNHLEPDAVIFNLQFASFGDKRLPAALGLLAPWLSSRKRPTATLLHNLFETVDLKSAGFDRNPLVDAATRFAGKMFTRALLKSDLVALTMPRYVSILQEKYGATNLFHAPHGSFDEPRPVEPLPESPTVMTFGKFGTYKKVEVLLEAHARLLEHDPRVRLVIAGSDSPNAKGYLASVEKSYHLPNVTYTGYVAEEEVPRIFSDSTVVAFPYESTTGSSGVLHQAGQFGRAAVMPRIGDLADLVEDEGYTARFFTPGDVESLTTSLRDVLFNRENAQRLGLQNHAASALTLSEVADDYLRRLRELQETRWTSANTPTAQNTSTS